MAAPVRNILDTTSYIRLHIALRFIGAVQDIPADVGLLCDDGYHARGHNKRDVPYNQYYSVGEHILTRLHGRSGRPGHRNPSGGKVNILNLKKIFFFALNRF
jgi:hypothetical protein